MTTTSDQPSGIGFEGADGHADRHHLRNGHRPFHLDGEADPADTHDFAALVEENDQLRARLDSLPIIEQSKDILMVRYQIDTDTAFALLRTARPHTPDSPPAIGPTLDEVLTWLDHGDHTPK